MENLLFQEMASNEETHWWFVGRRAILNKVLSKLSLAGDSEILESGCGTGGNLAMLARYGRTYCMESDETARELASARHIGDVAAGSLPYNIPYKDKTFDIVVIFDVLEHIEEDVKALHAVSSCLKHGGWLLVTVPAFNFLWSKHDVLHHHKRRYSAGGLRNIVNEAGFETTYVSYFNTLLFPAMVMGRLMKRLFGDKFPDGRRKPNGFINKILTKLLCCERHFIGSLCLPFGGSVLLLGRKI